MQEERAVRHLTAPGDEPRDDAVHRAVERRLAAFADTRRATLALVAALDGSRLARRPAPDRWSLGEILDHLFLSQRMYVDDLETLFARARRGEAPVLRRTFRDLDVSLFFLPRPLLPFLELPFLVAGALLPRSLRLALAGARWLPVRNPSVAEPRPGRRGDELRRDLDAAQERLERLIASAGDLDLAPLRISHPLLGVHDVTSLLDLMDTHEQRHQGQMREVLATLGGG